MKRKPTIIKNSAIHPLGISGASKQNYILPIGSDGDSSQRNSMFESDEDTGEDNSEKKDLGQKCPYVYRACCLGAAEYSAVFMLW